MASQWNMKNMMLTYLHWLTAGYTMEVREYVCQGAQHRENTTTTISIM